MNRSTDGYCGVKYIMDYGWIMGTLFNIIKLLFTNPGACDNNSLCHDRPD